MAKRKKHKVLTEGFLFGLIISGVANLITYQEFGMYNVLVGGILGVLVYQIFGIK